MLILFGINTLVETADWMFEVIESIAVSICSELPVVGFMSVVNSWELLSVYIFICLRR